MRMCQLGYCVFRAWPQFCKFAVPSVEEMWKRPMFLISTSAIGQIEAILEKGGVTFLKLDVVSS
jgi:hypothetical protein